MRKILLLGAGGTGANVIKRMQELVEWRKNSRISNFPNIQYLEVDTDPKSLPDASENFIHLGVSSDQVSRFKNEALQKGLHKWADIRELDAITNGASATRSKGKFGFLYHYNKIETAVKTRLNKLYATKTNDAGGTPQTKIYILANSVSGTGSGCFIDFGYMVRKIIKENETFRNDNALDVTLLFTLPVKTEDTFKLRNAFYALEELNHYMSDNPYSIDHATDLGVRIEIPALERAFDYVYLVGPKSGEKRIFESQELENIIGEYIYNDVFSPSADKRDSARDNMKIFMRQKDKLGYYQSYMTFGFSTIEYPAVQIAKAATYKYIMEALAQWRSESVDPPNYAYSTLHLGEGNHKTAGTIYNQLLRETPVKIHGGTTQAISVLRLIDELKNTALENFYADGYNTAFLEELIATIDMGFAADTIGLASGAYERGTVRNAVQVNKGLLEGESEGGWSRFIKNALVETMFSRQGGLKLVQRILEIIIEEKFSAIENKAISTQPPEAPLNEMRAICSDIDRIKGDMFLRIGWLQKKPISVLIEQYKEELDRYIDIRIAAVVIEAAKSLAAKAKRQIIAFKDRVDEFDRFLSGWHRELDKEYHETIEPQVLNGHIIMRDEISPLADKLIDTVGLGTVNFIQGSIAKTFTQNLLQNTGVAFKSRDKKDIVSNERKTFLDALGTKNVIEEFITEEERIAQASGARQDESLNIGTAKVKELSDRAELFISMTSRDDLVVTNNQIMQKRWFFYPGGEAVSNNNDYETNPFAAILYELSIVDDWSNQSQDSYDTYTIMFLQEKGCFPLRFLNLLRDDQMKRALDEVEGYSSEISNTYLSRMDVDFLPLKVIEAERLNQVKIVFLISIAAGTLVSDGEYFVHAPTEANESIFARKMRAPIKLPVIYKRAAYSLYKDRDALERLDEKNESYIKENQTEFLYRLKELLTNAGAYGLLLSDPDRDKTEILGLMADDFIRVKHDLLLEWDSLFENDKLAGDSVSFTYDYITDLDYTHPNRGFYCKLCGQYMGDASINGMPDYARVREFKRIHSCNR